MARRGTKFLIWLYYILFFLSTITHAEITSRKHLLFHFDKIEIEGEMSVFIEPGKRNREIEILADQAIIDSIGFRISNRTLFLEANNTFTFKRRIPFIGVSAVRSFPVEVLVKINSLKEGNVLGQSSLSLNRVRSEAFKLNFESCGNAHINEIECPNLEVFHRGTGDIFLRGSNVDMIDLEVSSSGNLTAEELFMDRAKVIHSGSGLVTLAPELWLDAKISGTGNIRLLEKPQGMVLNREHKSGNLVEEYESKKKVK